MVQSRVKTIEQAILAIPIVKIILARLKNELSPSLVYHDFNHTVDVIHEAVLFGVTDNLSDRQLIILGIAAAFHDAGFLLQHHNNEPLGAAMARTAMRKDGSYSAEEMDLVFSMVEDSSFHRGEPELTTSHSVLANYLLDADVSNFGREDFFDKTALVLKELGEADSVAFERAQLAMLTKHHWYTEAAKQLRQVQKEKNIEILRKNLKS